MSCGQTRAIGSKIFTLINQSIVFPQIVDILSHRVGQTNQKESDEDKAVAIFPMSWITCLWDTLWEALNAIEKEMRNDGNYIYWTLLYTRVSTRIFSTQINLRSEVSLAFNFRNQGKCKLGEKQHCSCHSNCQTMDLGMNPRPALFVNSHYPVPWCLLNHVDWWINSSLSQHLSVQFSVLSLNMSANY